jgi:hypothetical protein
LACHLLSHWYLARLIQPWRWRWYVPLKRQLTFNRLHSVISQKIVLFKVNGIVLVTMSRMVMVPTQYPIQCASTKRSPLTGKRTRKHRYKLCGYLPTQFHMPSWCAV